MQNEMDSFIKYLYTVEESCDSLTTDQFQKLCLIQTKVTELVDKVNTVFTSPIQTQQIQTTQSVPVAVQQAQPVAVSEKQVASFSEFITEKVAKRGKDWVVLDSKGKKVLGTHPSKEKAVKQLQAIEISKIKAKGTWKK
jgi:hypothetical protein